MPTVAVLLNLGLLASESVASSSTPALTHGCYEVALLLGAEYQAHFSTGVPYALSCEMGALYQVSLGVAASYGISCKLGAFYSVEVVEC